MKNQLEIQNAILNIIRVSLLRIRNSGWVDDSAGCASEADHVHNLPRLLLDFQPELVKFYWEVERVSFLKERSGQNMDDLIEYWIKLEKCLREAHIIE